MGHEELETSGKDHLFSGVLLSRGVRNEKWVETWDQGCYFRTLHNDYKNPSYTAGGKVDWGSCFGKQPASSSRGQS